MTVNVPVKKVSKQEFLNAIDEYNQNKDYEKIDISRYLSKGKYDIDYVISLCKVIDSQCKSVPMSNLGFTLSDSLRRLIAMLEVERDNYNLSKNME
jgi:hypothetical protein